MSEKNQHHGEFDSALKTLDWTANRYCCAGVRALVEAARCGLLFLLAYSPDLNPIEHIWATLKKLLQKKLHKTKRKIPFIMKTCLLLCE